MVQVLIPASAHERVAHRIAALPHDTELLLWSEGVVSDETGTTIDDPRPEAAWLSIDLFFTGEIMAFAEAASEMGTVKWVQGPLAGVDAPPFQKVLAAGIRLSNSDAPNIGVAEYVMSSLLAHRHGLLARVENQRSKTWAQAPWPEIGGQRWAIVGFGSIGREIAKRARPFGVEVVGVRRTEIEDPAADEMVMMTELLPTLGTVDVVILACPLTNDTRGLVDDEFLGAMRPDAVLVNVARGAVVATEALVAGLDSGQLGHAILDVFDPEPLAADSALWSHERITVTSHLAGAGSGFLVRNDDLFIEQLQNFLANEPLRLEIRAD